MATDLFSISAEATPPEAYAAALASMPDAYPSTLASLFCGFDAVTLWQGLVDGDRHVVAHARAALQGNRVDDFLDEQGPKISERVDLVVKRWQSALRADPPAAVWQRYCDAAVGVATRESASYPAGLVDDIAAPAVLFHRGTIDVVAGPRVGIVGTRTCTRYGRDVAHDLGEQLSKAGVAVVSGLATGIDAAAHAGSLHGSGPPIAVVGSGLDVIYPRANRQLWGDIETRGVVLSESPLGTPAHGWRFPARNRIIAALSDVLIVVESHASGGSLITHRQQAKREKPTLVVPGPILSPASKGSNALLRDGCAPLTDFDDVLVALGLSGAPRRSARESRLAPSAIGQEVLDVLGWQPATFDQLAHRSEISLGELAVALDDLVRSRWLEQRGSWFERVSRDRVSPR
jgi:DNA processing protein